MDKRPTSPHIQIYSWNISSLTSIMHRASGVALYFAVIIVCWYIVHYAYQINIGTNEDKCDCWSKSIMKVAFISSIFIITSALYYHFFNGIRHLFWDIDKGFDPKTSKINGYLVIFLAAFFTIMTIAISFYLKTY